MFYSVFGTYGLLGYQFGISFTQLRTHYLAHEIGEFLHIFSPLLVVLLQSTLIKPLHGYGAVQNDVLLHVFTLRSNGAFTPQDAGPQPRRGWHPLQERYLVELPDVPGHRLLVLETRML